MTEVGKAYPAKQLLAFIYPGCGATNSVLADSHHTAESCIRFCYFLANCIRPWPLLYHRLVLNGNGRPRHWRNVSAGRMRVKKRSHPFQSCFITSSRLFRSTSIVKWLDMRVAKVIAIGGVLSGAGTSSFALSLEFTLTDPSICTRINPVPRSNNRFQLLLRYAHKWRHLPHRTPRQRHKVRCSLPDRCPHFIRMVRSRLGRPHDEQSALSELGNWIHNWRKGNCQQ